jgi:kynurenine formamidase
MASNATNTVDAADVEALAARHRRWGRWGEDDERGALNFIGPEEIVRAAALVRRGAVFSCALPLDEDGPQTGTYGRANPQHTMLQDGGDIALGAQDHLARLRYTDDAIAMPLQCATHWDAFSHIFYGGAMYGGHGVEHVTSSGARRNGVEAFSASFVGRGVLLDVARHVGVHALEPGHGISGDDLAACARDHGVAVRRGDIVLVRTGQLAQSRAAGWPGYAGGDAPGLALSSAAFLCDSEIAAVATDTWGLEVRPNETDEVFQPLHAVLLVNAGIPFGEMLDLERLADDCAADGVYEFLFVAPPLPFTGAVGGPMNPVAIK